MKNNKMKKVFFVSLGCAKNLVDSEVMLGKLSETNEYVVTDKVEDADVIIVNTCSFVEQAKTESIEVILEMAKYKKFLVVAGCMSQRYYKELEKEMPEVDLFIGTGEYHKVVEHIKSLQEEKKLKTSKRSFVSTPTYIHSEKDKRLISTKSHTSWLKVSEGCNRHCSFCIIPKIRGNLRSRSVNSLLKEAQTLAQNGVKELNLVAQDLSVYGQDLIKSHRTNTNTSFLADLLKGLDQIDSLHWIRMLYFYPDNLNDQIIEVIANSKKICHYLDVPIQHLSDPILKKMNRKITSKKILDNIHKIRKALPNIVLRTSIIVGFPGEEDHHFEELIEGIKSVKFNHLGVFKYSEEENTAASKMKKKVDQEIIDNRYDQVYRIQKRISRALNKKYIGKDVEVLIEGVHEETDLLLQGRFYGQAPDIDGKVIINDLGEMRDRDRDRDREERDGTPKNIKIGDFVKVKIEDFHDYDLVGGISYP
ncbi:MAG: 30S ribosomal protein S12 methylthiotransferase RimO [Oligoflexia bacterium]|nr:30S ribosomal protein S12 methylthiotransferase RimO [Oligoflexia bacterium]